MNIFNWLMIFSLRGRNQGNKKQSVPRGITWCGMKSWGIALLCNRGELEELPYVCIRLSALLWDLNCIELGDGNAHPSCVCVCVCVWLIQTRAGIENPEGARLNRLGWKQLVVTNDSIPGDRDVGGQRWRREWDKVAEKKQSADACSCFKVERHVSVFVPQDVNMPLFILSLLDFRRAWICLLWSSAIQMRSCPGTASSCS